MDGYWETLRWSLVAGKDEKIAKIGFMGGMKRILRLTKEMAQSSLKVSFLMFAALLAYVNIRIPGGLYWDYASSTQHQVPVVGVSQERLYLSMGDYSWNLIVDARVLLWYNILCYHLLRPPELYFPSQNAMPLADDTDNWRLQKTKSIH